MAETQLPVFLPLSPGLRQSPVCCPDVKPSLLLPPNGWDDFQIYMHVRKNSWVLENSPRPRQSRPVCRGGCRRLCHKEVP